MAFGTYADLQAQVIAWAIRTGDDEFAVAVPGFIALAEATLNYGNESQSQIRTREMIETATITITNGYGDLPDDYLEYVDTDSALGRGLAPSVKRWNDPNFHNSSPRNPDQFYIEGNRIRVAPIGAATVDLTYYAMIPALSDANQINWLLRKYPNIYLYLTLMYASLFMEDDARASTFSQLYAQSLGGLVVSDVRSRANYVAIRAQGVTP